MSDLFRVYFDPAEVGLDGYPYAWREIDPREVVKIGESTLGLSEPFGIKDLVREQADHRCVRCGHPYRKGMGEWSPCDERCIHDDDGPIRVLQNGELMGLYKAYNGGLDIARAGWDEIEDAVLEAQWRVLTVHHLTGIKIDCRWWNLVALCQMCHLSVQGRVRMAQVYPHPHRDWFKPYAAGYYAAEYLGLALTRDETMERLDELLALELDASYRE